MRVSVDKNDSGFRNYVINRPFRVFVDDLDVSGIARMADEEAGVAEVILLNDRGTPFIDGNSVATEILKGKVAIVRDTE